MKACYSCNALCFCDASLSAAAAIELCAEHLCYSTPSSQSQQRRHIVQVAAENQKILKRLNSRKSTVSSSTSYSRKSDYRNGMAGSGHHQRHMEAHRNAQQQRQWENDRHTASRVEVKLRQLMTDSS